MFLVRFQMFLFIHFCGVESRLQPEVPVMIHRKWNQKIKLMTNQFLFRLRLTKEKSHFGVFTDRPLLNSRRSIFTAHRMVTARFNPAWQSNLKSFRPTSLIHSDRTVELLHRPLWLRTIHFAPSTFGMHGCYQIKFFDYLTTGPLYRSGLIFWMILAPPIEIFTGVHDSLDTTKSDNELKILESDDSKADDEQRGGQEGHDRERSFEVNDDQQTRIKGQFTNHSKTILILSTKSCCTLQ